MYQQQLIASEMRESEVAPEVVTIDGEEVITKYVTNKKTSTLVMVISIVSGLLFLCSICVCVFICRQYSLNKK